MTFQMLSLMLAVVLTSFGQVATVPPTSTPDAVGVSVSAGMPVLPGTYVDPAYAPGASMGEMVRSVSGRIGVATPKSGAQAASEIGVSGIVGDGISEANVKLVDAKGKIWSETTVAFSLSSGVREFTATLTYDGHPTGQGFVIVSPVGGSADDEVRIAIGFDH